MHLWCVLSLDLGGVDEEDVTGSPEDDDEMKPMVFIDGKDERTRGVVIYSWHITSAAAETR